MKKALLAVVSLMLAVCCCFPALAEDQELTYIFGGASDPNRAKLRKMGQQSWYPMYSTQTNAGENIDLSTFKECVLSETGLWKPAEEVTLKSFVPGEEDQDVTYRGAWFSIRKDGFNAGDTGYSSAIKWVCEADGVYDINIAFSGGTAAGAPEEGYFQEDGVYIPAADGVYMSMYVQQERVFCVDSYAGVGHRIEQTEMDLKEVELKAGDCVWLVTDTKSNGGWDDPWWCLRITLVSK